MPSSPTILFADPDPTIQTACLQLFNTYAPSCVHNCSASAKLITALESSQSNILFLNLLLLAGQDYIKILDTIAEKFPDILLIVAFPHNDQIVEQQIISRDIFFYVNTPYDTSEIKLALKRAVTKLNLPPTNQSPEQQQEAVPFYGIIGETPVMQKLFNLITKVSEDDFATVLIRGESGTGKELVARAIHLHSNRKKNNFVPVNCAAIPDDLLESELFGYTKGAFTGAVQNKMGRIQYADGGTLFLDEIGDMKPSLQAKLLRVLQEREFEPVGGLKATPVDIRVVAATHCNLEQLVSDGKFREDLYYRLSVIPLLIPRLEERKADIPILLNTFLDAHATKRGREKFTVPLSVMTALLSYKWKGNVRELENLVQQLSVLCSGRTIRLDDLPERILEEFNPDSIDKDSIASILQQASLRTDIVISASTEEQTTLLPSKGEWDGGQVNFKDLINDYESQLIIKAMKLTDGNKKEAAQLLNLKRTTLLEKIKKKDLQGLWEDN